jgi:large subunit ribosomal protein L18
MKSALEKNARRAQRMRSKIRKVSGGRLRLSVHRSSKNISAQIIDDRKGVTLVAA